MKYIGAVLLVLAVLLFLVAHRHRMFARFTVRELAIPGGTLVFSVYQGSYGRMAPFAKKVRSEICDRVVPEEEARAFAIYYDDPSTVDDATKCRALVGVIIDKKQESLTPRFDVRDFARKSKSYHTVDFQSLDAFGTTFPLRTSLSTTCAVRWGYPAIRRYGAQKGLMDSARCALEIYDHKAGEMTICFPHGPSADFILYLSGLPAPSCKSKNE